MKKTNVIKNKRNLILWVVCTLTIAVQDSSAGATVSSGENAGEMQSFNTTYEADGELRLTVRARPDDTVIELSWEPPDGLEVAGYRVYYAGSARPIHGDRLLDSPEFSDIGLTNGRKYTYQVVAVLPDGKEWREYEPVSATPGYLKSGDKVFADFEPFTGMTFPSVRDNSLIRLSDYAGKVLLLNWGRSNCGWTHRQTPRLAELYEKYRDRGLEIVGIMAENGTSISSLEEFSVQPGITWPLGIMDQGEYARDILQCRPNCNPIGTGHTPETFLITRSGELKYVGLYRGDEYWEELESTVEEALTEPAPSEPSIVPRPLPETPAFELPDLEGKPMSLDDFTGQPLVVHFFTDGSCDWAGQLLGELHRQHGEEVAFAGIGYGSESSLQNCVSGQGLDFPVLIGDRETQRNWGRNSSVWAVYFITPEWRIVKEISRSLIDGIEDVIFPHYVELLAAGYWDVKSR